MTVPLAIRAALLAVVGALLLAAPPAQAKEGVRATLEHPERLRDAAPGERIALAWRLRDAAGRPFGAGGIHLRVRGAAGGRTRLIPARARGGAGRYAANLTIPAGGIAKIAVGLEGIRLVAGHAPVRADMVFPIVNDPLVVRWSPLGPLWPRVDRSVSIPR